MNDLPIVAIKLLRFQSAAIPFAAAVFVLIFTVGSVFGSAAEEIGIITADDLNMRPEAGTNSPPIMVLQKGAEVKIIKNEGKWLKIEYNGRVGYIQNRDRYVRIIAVRPVKEKKTDSELLGGQDQKIERFKKKVEEIERQIEEREATLQTITAKEMDVLGSLNELDLTMDKARGKISTTKVQLEDLEKRIAKTTEQHKSLIKQIEINEDYAAKRLVAIYKIRWIGKMNFIASAQSMHELMQRQRTLERIFTHDEQVRQSLLEDKNRLKEMLDRLNAQQLKKRTLQANIKEQINKISRNRDKRAALLEEIRNKRSLQVAAIESLTQAAVTLDKTIETLEMEKNPDQELTNVTMQPFSEFKGLLKMPVKGKIISSFGAYKHPKLNVTNFRSGIDIESEVGATVQAVFSGRVIYASWFKGYGNMIIIDHGDSYYTVYAHLESLLKTRGEYLNTGDDIATVGDTGSMSGPALYFEVRHHGKPMDPLEWIVKG